jgi:hypothetical protein
MTRLFIFASLGLLLVGGYASAATMTSGRPSAVLTKKQCKTVWKRAVPHGHYLYKANAAPFIVNWRLANPDGDGTISKHEFKKACSKGLGKNTVR